MKNKDIISLKKDVFKILNLALLIGVLIGVMIFSQASMLIVNDGFDWVYLLNIIVAIILIILSMTTLKILKSRFKPLNADIKNHDDGMEN